MIDDIKQTESEYESESGESSRPAFIVAVVFELLAAIAILAILAIFSR